MIKLILRLQWENIGSVFYLVTIGGIKKVHCSHPACYHPVRACVCALVCHADFSKIATATDFL